MIAIVADTHAEEDHALTGRTLEAVRAAEVVIHAGDFRTAAVLEAFEREAAPAAVAGVRGNNDDTAVRERLPGRRTLEVHGFRIVVVHGHEHTDTALSLLGRQEGAELVVVGHSHRPGVESTDGPTLVNPGSHSRPRRFRPAHAELDADGRGRLVDPDGTVFEEFRIEA